MINDLFPTPATVLPISEFVDRWWEAAPEMPGVYFLLLDDAQPLLRRCNYYRYADRPPAMVGERLLANIGSTTKLTLSLRINHHVWGDARRSSLRRSIAVLWGPRWLQAHGAPSGTSFHLGARGERWANGFLQRYGHIGWWSSDHPAREEYELIGQHQPMLNLHGLERLSWTQHVCSLRRRWADAAQA